MNDKKINVLLFPSCSEVAMASHECLKNIRFINIFGGSLDGSISKNTFKNLITGIPNIKSPEFIDGSVHAKVAVADSEIGFITSANLTGYAMEKNMEAGILLRGGDVPKTLMLHLNSLVDTKIISKLNS